MELFGIVCAVPAAFIAAAIYTQCIRLVLRYGLIRSLALRVSIAILCGLALEWVALLTIGVLRSRAIIGPAFYPLHLVLFFLAVPALANLLLIKRGDSVMGSWFMVASLCAGLALPVVLTQYEVAEALYGIDGNGGPYGQAPTIPMPGWW